jgi:transcriptional regulator with XRE-family HTH domain
VDQLRVGAAFRAVRLKRRWRQEDVAMRARLHRSTVSLIERGHWDRLSFEAMARAAGALEIRLEVIPRWRGGDLDRLMNAGHSHLHEVVARVFGAIPEWQHQPEVSFALYGERGWIDILSFHESTGSLLIVELKTEIVDVQQLVGVMDRKLRLGPQIGRQRGWAARLVSGWVVVADTRTNRRRLAAHGAMLRSAFPADGRQMRRWLHQPVGVVRALSFMPYAHGVSASHVRTGVKRVRSPA